MDQFAWTVLVCPVAALSDYDRGLAIWTLTAFPACGFEHMCSQLEDVAKKLTLGQSVSQQFDEWEIMMALASKEE